MSPPPHQPAHLSHPCSQQHRHSARPPAHTPHCGDIPPPLYGRAVAGAWHSPPHLSHPGSHGHHHSAGPGPHTARSGRGTRLGYTPLALQAGTGLSDGTVPIGIPIPPAQGTAHPATQQVAQGSACSWTQRKSSPPTSGAGTPPGAPVPSSSKVSPQPCSSVWSRQSAWPSHSQLSGMQRVAPSQRRAHSCVGLQQPVSSEASGHWGTPSQRSPAPTHTAPLAQWKAPGDTKDLTKPAVGNQGAQTLC